MMRALIAVLLLAICAPAQTLTVQYQGSVGNKAVYRFPLPNVFGWVCDVPCTTPQGGTGWGSSAWIPIPGWEPFALQMQMRTCCDYTCASPPIAGIAVGTAIDADAPALVLPYVVNAYSYIVNPVVLLMTEDGFDSQACKRWIARIALSPQIPLGTGFYVQMALLHFAADGTPVLVTDRPWWWQVVAG